MALIETSVSLGRVNRELRIWNQERSIIMTTENGFTQESTAVGTSGAILTQQSYTLPLRCLGHRTARVTLFYPDPDPVPVRYSSIFYCIPPKTSPSRSFRIPICGSGDGGSVFASECGGVAGGVGPAVAAPVRDPRWTGFGFVPVLVSWFFSA